MWKKKGIIISSASVIDMKAELMKTSQSVDQKRKYREELPEVITTGAKIQKPNISSSTKDFKHKNDYSYDNRDDDDGISRGKIDCSIEEEQYRKKLEESYVSLQRKTLEYENSLKRDPDEWLQEELDRMHNKSVIHKQQEESLVDFLSKDDSLIEKDTIVSTLKSNKNLSDLKVTDDPWIEYTDDFGRTRLMRQSEAKKFGKFVKSENTSNEITVSTSHLNDNLSKSLVSEDMKREQERREWEQRAYQDVQKGNHQHYNMKGEIRTLGVGYYQFSLDEEERREQMNQLDEIRSSTMKEREQASLVKEKKKDAREQRRQMLMQKRKKKLALQSSETEEVADKNAHDTKTAVDDFFQSLG